MSNTTNIHNNTTHIGHHGHITTENTMNTNDYPCETATMARLQYMSHADLVQAADSAVSPWDIAEESDTEPTWKGPKAALEAAPLDVLCKVWRNLRGYEMLWIGRDGRLVAAHHAVKQELKRRDVRFELPYAPKCPGCSERLTDCYGGPNGAFDGFWCIHCTHYDAVTP